MADDDQMQMLVMCASSGIIGMVVMFAVLQCSTSKP
jgi:hypothetical protein